MFGVTDSMHARQILASITSTGIEVPAVTEAWAEVELLNSQARQIAPGDLPGVVATAILAGHDPASDPDVQHVVTAQAIATEGTVRGVAALAYGMFRTVCAEHADPLVIAWRGPFDQAAETLTTAHERIGAVQLDDAATILLQGGDIAVVWARARAAVATIESVLTGWAALGEYSRTAPTDRNHRALRLADIAYPLWESLDGNVGPWELVGRGVTLALPTAREYRERVAAIDAQATAAAQTGEVDSLRSSIAGREIRSVIG